MKLSCYVKHFIFLNLVVGLLGLGIVSDLPSRFYLTVETDAPMSVVSDSGRGCTFKGKGVQTAHLWLPLDADLSRLTFRKTPDDAAFRFVRARLWCHLLWERKWEADAIQTDAQGKLVLEKEKASAGLSKVAVLGLVGGEIGLAVLSLLFVALAKILCRSTDATRTSRLQGPAIVAAVALAVLCVGIIPMQTFLANHVEMGLTLGPVLLDLSWRFVLVAVVAAALLLWSLKFANALYPIATAAVLLYLYLETGLLSFDYPSFTGDMRFFTNLTRMAWDALVLPVSFVVLLLAYRKLPQILTYLPLAIVVLGLASLCDVKHSDLPTKIESEIVSEFKPKDQVLREVVYSSKRNILMYVLDATATPYLLDLFLREPKFAEELTGFVCYTNHLGMYSLTVNAVAGMSTGKHCETPGKLASYRRSTFSRDSFLASYLASDAAVFVNPGQVEVGVSVGGRKVRPEENPQQKELPLNRRMTGGQPFNLAEIIQFRMMPFCLKFVCYVFTSAAWPLHEGPNDETVAYPVLASAPMIDTLGSSLHVWHTVGIHWPLDVNRYGIKDGVVRDGYDAAIEKIWYVWSQVSRLLARLKERGLYDKSMIVITVDHGQGLPGELPKKCLNNGRITSCAWPILLVKPIGGSENFSYTNLSTSHARLHDLMVAACTNNLTHSEIAALLKSEERYYCLPNDGQFEKLYVASDRTPTLRVVKSANDVLKSCIKLNHQYSLLASNHDDMPPIQFKGFSYGSVDSARVAVSTKTMLKPVGSVSFKVQDPTSTYRVKFFIKPGMDMRVVDDNTKKAFLVSNMKYECEVDVSPNPQGHLSLSFYSMADVCLQSIEVNCLDK